VLVRKIVEAAPDHLEAGGLLAIEIGAGEGPEAQRLLEARGFREVRLDRDIARATDPLADAKADERQTRGTARSSHNNRQRPYRKPERRPSGPSAPRR